MSTEWLFGRCKGLIILFFQYRHIGDTADRYRCRQTDSGIADTDTSIGLVANTACISLCDEVSVSVVCVSLANVTRELSGRVRQ